VSRVSTTARPDFFSIGVVFVVDDVLVLPPHEAASTHERMMQRAAAATRTRL